MRKWSRLSADPPATDPPNDLQKRERKVNIRSKTLQCPNLCLSEKKKKKSKKRRVKTRKKLDRISFANTKRYELLWSARAIAFPTKFAEFSSGCYQRKVFNLWCYNEKYISGAPRPFINPFLNCCAWCVQKPFVTLAQLSRFKKQAM